jgi:hypothetical protein
MKINRLHLKCDIDPSHKLISFAIKDKGQVDLF